MPLRSDWSGQDCPIARSLDVLGDPWVMLVIRQALTGVARFDELRDELGVADNVLSRRLRDMVAAGLLDRHPYEGGRHEYRLTEAGRDLLPVINALVLWGERHRPMPGRTMELVHPGCGAVSTSAERCSACGAELRPGDAAWRKSWRDHDTPIPAG